MEWEGVQQRQTEGGVFFLIGLNMRFFKSPSQTSHKRNSSTTSFKKKKGKCLFSPEILQRSEWVKVAESSLVLCDPMDCNLPGSSVHGILQASVLEWVAIFFSRRSSWPRDQTQVSCIAGRFFIIWATREAEECWWTIPFMWLSKMSLHPLPSYYPYKFSSHTAWQLPSFPSFTLKFSEFS